MEIVFSMSYKLRPKKEQVYKDFMFFETSAKKKRDIWPRSETWQLAICKRSTRNNAV
jgi:hypothetical protein